MCCNCTVTHAFGCITPDLLICSPCDNDACLSTTPPPPPPPIFSPFTCLLGSLLETPAHCLHGNILLHCWLIEGNAFVFWSDWASAASSAVMTRTGRCCRSRFGGAILLTRSLLRQAASNTTWKCVISSKTCLWQTVGDLCITFLFHCYWIWH